MNAVVTSSLLRLASGLLAIVGALTLVFFVVRLSGDPVASLLPPDATEDTRKNLRQAYGLDEPVLTQYVRYLSGAVRGDFGLSIRLGEPAMAVVLQRLPVTLELTAAALLVAVFLAVCAAFASLRSWPLADGLSAVLVLLGQALPTFWVGSLLIALVAVQWGWLPSSGRSGPSSLILPALTLALYSAALLTRTLRVGLLEAQASDFVRTARSKGLSELAVMRRHTLRAALIPSITLLGVQFSHLIGGAIVVETVFAYPGMGLLAVQAVTNYDAPVVQAFVVVTTAAVLAVSITLDLLYPLIDPRIRYR